MGMWERITNWVEEKIGAATAKLRQWVLDTINSALEELRVWRFNFRQWLAEITSTALGFWLFVVLLVAVAVVGVYVQSTEMWLSFKALVKAQIAILKQRVGTTLAYTGYSVALSFHNLAMLFVPSYKDAWVEIYEGLAALSEEFRLGVSGVNNALRAARNLGATALTLGGVPAVGAFVTANERTGTFLSALESRLERYVRDPHLIFIDIDAEIVAPAMAEMDSAVSNILLDISNLNATLNDKAQLIIELQANIDELVTSMPEEIAAAMRGTWDSVSERMDVFREDYLDPFIEYSAGVRIEVNRQLRNNTLRIGEAQLLLAAPGSLLGRIVGMVEPFRGWQARLVGWIAGLAEHENAAVVEPMIRARTLEIARDVHARLEPDYQPVGRQLIVSGIAREALAESAYRTWYVGDY